MAEILISESLSRLMYFSPEKPYFYEKLSRSMKNFMEKLKTAIKFIVWCPPFL